MNYEEILLNYAKYFQQSDVVESAIRTVGWKLILLLRGICDACQSVWEAVFRVLSFTQVISEKLGTYYPIWNAIFLVTILAVGTVFLYSERRPPFLKNLIITMAVVMLLPGGVQLGVQLLGIEQNVFMANGTSVADTTVISNTTDLLYLKQNGWTFESPNCFTGETIKYIDQNEQVEKKTDKVFKYYMIVDESSGKVKYKEIKKGFFGFLTPLYYRYSINFMAIIGELIVNILVLIFASYRLFRLIWDMIYGEILAYIFSGDVMSGEKTKQTLQYLLNLFWSISIMIWGFAIWREFELWVAKEYSNNFVRILLIAFAGIAMIDGPDIVERVLGIDVGMKDGLMKTIGAMHLLQAGLGATGVGKAAAKAASKVKEESLNPGGKEEQERLSKGAKEPPGGAGNAGNSSSSGATQNRRQEALNGRAAEANMLVRNLRNQRKQQKLHHKEMLHHRSILHPVGRNQMPHLEHRQVILNQLEILHPKEPNMEHHQRKFRVVRLRLRKQLVEKCHMVLRRRASRIIRAKSRRLRNKQEQDRNRQERQEANRKKRQLDRQIINSSRNQEMEARLNQGKQQRKADRQKQRIPQSRNRQEKPPLLENLEKNQRQELLGNRHKRSHRRMHSLLIQMKDRKLWSHKNHQRIGEVLEKQITIQFLSVVEKMKCQKGECQEMNQQHRISRHHPISQNRTLLPSVSETDTQVPR